MTAKDFLTILRATCVRAEKCSECVFGVFCGEDPRDMTAMVMDSLIRIAEDQAENERTIRTECAGKMFTLWALRQRFEDELEKTGFTEEQRSAAGECFARAVRKYAEDRGFLI